LTEAAVRKISKSRSAIDNQYTDIDERPRRIPGATITSWHGSPEIDLGAMFEQWANGPTVAGAAETRPNRRPKDTVSLSDGTRITFSGTNQFKPVLTT
jgi:hypothetical protein